MIARAIGAICGLIRLDTCVLAFASVFAPVYFSSRNLYFSLTQALPILTICMCGFVINDLNDLDKDRLNHPHRALPSNSISVFCASALYFSLLAGSLVLIKVYVELPHVYLYLLFLVALTNYNYVIDYAPVAKGLYVAAASTIPILILTLLLHNKAEGWFVAAALFLFVLGRETLMDISDVAGDRHTPALMLGEKAATNVAFGLVLLGSLCLYFASDDFPKMSVTVILILADGAVFYFWTRRRYRRFVIHVMKLQLLVGIYYLF